MRLLIALLSMLLWPYSAWAGPFAWPAGRLAAIALTYDDALQSDLDVAIPQLQAAGFRGTFFLKADNVFPRDIARWRAASLAGHELGNHSVNHPCPRAMLPGRDHYATESYDAEIMLTEIRVNNALLAAIDGDRPRTYSYPCSQSLVGGRDYIPALRTSGIIRYARNGGDAWRSIVSDMAALDPLNVPSWGPVDHPDGAALIAYVERVRASGGFGVLQFHGVGGDYLEVSAEAHRQLLAYLRAHPEIWVARFQDLMDHVTRQSPRR
jgi:peptidoglycan/xylan/chitin deacetylase (PgdA/CDA1 family)